MELPPLVKTQHPTKDTIATDKIVPVPIETAFFLEDAEKDKTKLNRYYFNFPAEWSTSNKGESIIGVRSARLIRRRRKIELNIKIFKVLYSGLGKDEKLKDILPNIKKSKTLDDSTFYDLQPKDYTGIISLKIIDWISSEGDFRGFFDALNEQMKSTIKIWNKLYENNTQKLDFWEQYDEYINLRDIQADGYYDDNGFHEIIYSYKNLDQTLFNCAVYFKIESWNDDFAELFNIGTNSTQNNPAKYKIWSKELIFDHVWDRQKCKIFSSIAEQSLHHYIGDTDVVFTPIKYYKLSSMDSRFWIEFYSNSHYDLPIKLPRDDSFVIEMIFLPYDKLLYV